MKEPFAKLQMFMFKNTDSGQVSGPPYVHREKALMNGKSQPWPVRNSPGFKIPLQTHTGPMEPLEMSKSSQRTGSEHRTPERGHGQLPEKQTQWVWAAREE